MQTQAACGQVYVASVNAWMEMGGQDERFESWGLEDSAFALAWKKHYGEEMVHGTGVAYSIDHPAKRVASMRNQELLAEWRSK